MPRPRPLTFAELHALLPRLAATAKLLEGLAGRPGAGARASAGRGAAASSGNGRRGRRASGAGEALRAKLFSALKGAKNGLSLADVAKRAGVPRAASKYHLRALRAQKKARVVGDRRRARWFAV
jgi:hypothetical protein